MDYQDLMALEMMGTPIEDLAYDCTTDCLCYPYKCDFCHSEFISYANTIRSDYE